MKQMIHGIIAHLLLDVNNCCSAMRLRSDVIPCKTTEHLSFGIAKRAKVEARFGTSQISVRRKLEKETGATLLLSDGGPICVRLF